MKDFILKEESLTRDKRVYLTVKTYAKENRSLSWFHLFTVIICVIGSYLILFFNSNSIILLPISFLLSLLLVRFFVIYHDFVHKAILQNSPFATFIFTCFGLFILAPIGIWQRSHNHHHQNNSRLDGPGIGSFPVMTRNDYVNPTWTKRFSYLVARHPFTILFGYFTTFILGMCLRSLFYNYRKHWDSIVALILHSVLGWVIFNYAGISLFILAFLMPAVLSSCLGSYLFYAQHNYPGVVLYLSGNWSHYRAATASSSYIKMNPVMEWFTANIGYHHIHHLNAAIPFYNLPKAYKAIPELRICQDSTLHPFDIWKCLRLKVWDQSLNKMTGLRDFKVKKSA
jgi:acyl-lipid omega-6 desaturase (Delta-12 desaturase)